MADTTNFTLQLKRNNTVYGTKADALSGLKSFLTGDNAKVGEPAIAVYGSTNKAILFGIKGLEKGEYQIFEGATVGIDGNIEIPEAVQEAIQDALDELKGKSGYDDFDDIKKAIEELLGDADEGYKSFEDIQNKIEGMSATMPTGNVVTKVTQTDGKVSVEAKTLASADKTIVVSDELDLKVNIDNETLTQNDGVISVASKALTMTGKDAIAVADGTSGKEVSLKINTSDKILSQDSNGLLTNLTLKYVAKTDSATALLQLIGKEDAVVSSIDATAFVKDGMLSNAELKKGSDLDGEYTADNTYLVLSFNTDGGTTPIVLDVTELIDVYTAGNGLELTGKAFSVKVKDNDKYLEVTSAGLASKGIDTAIAEAIKDAVNGEDGESSIVKAGNGINVVASDGQATVSIKVKEGETYLEATANGLATKGIDTLAGKVSDLEEAIGEGGSVETQIENAIADLDADETGESTDKHVKVQVVEEDGVITGVTVTTSDIASASELATLKGLVGESSVATQISTEINKLDVEDTAVDGQFVTKVSETDGKIEVTRGDVNANKVKVTEIKSGDSTLGVIEGVGTTATNVQDALKQLFELVVANEQVDAAAIVALKELLGSGVSEDLTLTFDSKCNYVKDDTTFQDAIETLDDKLEEVASEIDSVRSDFSTIDCGTY